MTQPSSPEWAPVAVPGTVNPIALPDQAATGSPVYWPSRPRLSQLTHRPAGTSTVISLDDRKRR